MNDEKDFARYGFADASAIDGLVRGAEDVVSVDNDAIRIMPPLTPGWDRAILQFDSVPRQAGQAFAVCMLNGHNTSQAERLPEPFYERMDRWLHGDESHSRLSRFKRFRQWPFRQRMKRQFKWWWRLRRSGSLEELEENLAVGFFPLDQVERGYGDAQAFVMHATGPNNGELWVQSAGVSQTVATGVRNVPLYLLVVLRPQGAVYYAASSPGTRQFPGFGTVRPLLIDTQGSVGTASASPAVNQSTLGQIGFRTDSRIYGCNARQVDSWSDWYTSAQAAAAFVGTGTLPGQDLLGNRWQVESGGFRLSEDGLEASAAPARLRVPLAQPNAIVSCRVDARDCAGLAILELWQGDDGHTLYLQCSGQGRLSLVAVSAETTDTLGEAHVGVEPFDLQIVDRDDVLEIYAAGRKLLTTDLRTLGPARPVFSLELEEAAPRISWLEMHPLALVLPPELSPVDPVLVRPPGPRTLHEDFAGSGELKGKTITTGGDVWERIIGTGHIDLEKGGRVRGTVDQPNPGRTAHAVNWTDPAYASLRMQIAIPGTQIGDKHRCRCGFVFWQDDDNYITTSIWNSPVYEGSSVSSFYTIAGFENLYDAIWTNVGTNAAYGSTVALTATYDNGQLLMTLNDEPVLYRRVSDVYADVQGITLRKVGIVVNWEWGDDTGSGLADFEAFGPGVPR